jgi:hypothetical protein
MSHIPPQDVSIEALAAAKPLGHAHASHAHTSHPHGHRRIKRTVELSLLRLSALERLGGVCLLLAGLWALVFWALH